MPKRERRLLLCTDLDRTLIPNGTAPEDPRARQIFATLCDSPDVILTYVTGRDRALVRAAIRDYALPLPDYVISDVGSKIYRLSNDSWDEWTVWEEHLQEEWPSATHRRIISLLQEIPDLLLQEEARQSPHKVSYYLPLSLDVTEIIDLVRTRLEGWQIPANLIWSIDEAKNIGLLDLLPRRADKRLAIEFLRRQLNYQQDEVLFAGDSGNDLAVIESDIPSVLVANAAAEVKLAARNWALQNNGAATLYIAKGGLLQMNGNYCAGILEGICHFAPEFRPLVEGR